MLWELLFMGSRAEFWIRWSNSATFRQTTEQRFTVACQKLNNQQMVTPPLVCTNHWIVKCQSVQCWQQVFFLTCHRKHRCEKSHLSWLQFQGPGTGTIPVPLSHPIPVMSHWDNVIKQSHHCYCSYIFYIKAVGVGVKISDSVRLCSLLIKSETKCTSLYQLHRLDDRSFFIFFIWNVISLFPLVVYIDQD